MKTTKINRSTIKTKTFKKCPFCGGKIEEKYINLQDRLYTTNEKFSVGECVKCHTGILNPAPSGDQSKYYPPQYLSSEEDNKNQDVKKRDLETWYRYNQYKFDFNLLKKATGLNVDSIKSYIDIGCGSGERVTYVKERGCSKSYGVDKFDFAKSKTKLNAEIINSDVLKYNPKNKFQVGSLFHVLEHLENPKEFLKHVSNNILAKDGYLIVQVPNYDSIERHVFKNRWFSFDVPRHLWQFNERSLQKLLEESGYEVVDSYKVCATLHPVTIAPSILRDLDVQRIWVNKSKSDSWKKAMKACWAIATIVTIPLSLIQNSMNRAAMLTVIAKNKS